MIFPGAGHGLMMGGSFGTITLTAGAGTISGRTYQGYSRSIFGTFGSLSAQPLSGQTLEWLFEDNENRSVDIAFVGNRVTQLAPYTRLFINDVLHLSWNGWVYNGSNATYPDNTGSRVYHNSVDLVSGQQYRIRLE